MKKWIKAAGIRAIKTFAESCLGFVVVGLSINDINWLMMLSVASVAALSSILISIKGLPEL